MSHPLRAIVLIETRPGRGAEQAAAFTALAPVVRAEPGCLRYDMHAVEGDPDRFVLIEEWASAEALRAHDAAPHMREADLANRAFRAGPATMVRLAPEPIA
ncbi:antibiotic biosynthesis monooxygenase family protein [Actinoplanes oblitus]|uniref:Antibiotic biosynthesis monooxygenase family protein n=1 Tax=Actinoplanes oblitus TaxID=3040509 RepID=A0ABY8W5U0_9ACTN|nr:antibiotic biosynthesis monooxygenase family protein [Actinoplanes oblitus]WIM93068.1 antibiotic biosynthesis monooxygenase family protein [Actinoplanes oblitus]